MLIASPVVLAVGVKIIIALAEIIETTCCLMFMQLQLFLLVDREVLKIYRHKGKDRKLILTHQ